MDDFNQTTAALGETLRVVGNDLISAWLLIQVGLIVVALSAAYLISTQIRRRVAIVDLTMGWPPILRLIVRTLIDNLGTILFVVLTGLIRATMMQLTWPSRSYLVGVAASLATAWVVIALVTVLIRNPFVYRLVAISAWTIAALSILELLDPVTAALNSVGVTLGGLRITPLLLLKTTVLLLIALWAAASVSNFIELRLRASADLTPSVQVLVAKLVRVVFIGVAILVVLSSVGIDLSALALLGGAVGVGIGFGLQKIVSNFVSGIILLADKSIKPGDVISVGDGMGWVQSMNARYTSVTQRDGREVLIPNEDLVTQAVTNWSYTNNEVMLQVTFGVSYDSDPHHVREIAMAAVKEVPRVFAEPGPSCNMTGFGASSLDFVVYFWIGDPVNGLANVRSAALLALWDAFKREGIKIPYPVTDLRVTTPVRLQSLPAERPASPD